MGQLWHTALKNYRRDVIKDIVLVSEFGFYCTSLLLESVVAGACQSRNVLRYTDIFHVAINYKNSKSEKKHLLLLPHRSIISFIQLLLV